LTLSQSADFEGDDLVVGIDPRQVKVSVIDGLNDYVAVNLKVCGQGRRHRQVIDDDTSNGGSQILSRRVLEPAITSV